MPVKSESGSPDRLAQARGSGLAGPTRRLPGTQPLRTRRAPLRWRCEVLSPRAPYRRRPAEGATPGVIRRTRRYRASHRTKRPTKAEGGPTEVHKLNPPSAPSQRGGETPSPVKRSCWRELASRCPLWGDDDVAKLTIHHITPYADSKQHDLEKMVVQRPTRCRRVFARTSRGRQTKKRPQLSPRPWGGMCDGVSRSQPRRETRSSRPSEHCRSPRSFAGSASR